MKVYFQVGGNINQYNVSDYTYFIDSRGTYIKITDQAAIIKALQAGRSEVNITESDEEYNIKFVYKPERIELFSNVVIAVLTSEVPQNVAFPHFTRSHPSNSALDAPTASVSENSFSSMEQQLLRMKQVLSSQPKLSSPSVAAAAVLLPVQSSQHPVLSVPVNADLELTIKQTTPLAAKAKYLKYKTKYNELKKTYMLLNN